MSASTQAVSRPLFERPSVTDRIRCLPRGGVCLISAAPGYGATTALRHALAGEGAVWLSARHRTDRFSSLDVEQAFISSQGDGWLVLDGVPDDDDLLAAVLAGIDSMSARARLVVASHHELPALLTGSGGRIVDRLTESDLRWDEDDGLAFLQAAVPGIDVDVAVRMVHLAEGWITALAAVAAATRARPDPEWLTGAGADVLFRTWWRHLPVADRDLFTATSALDLLSAGPVGACTGLPDPGRRIADLALDHAYVEEVPAPPGHSGRWWRRHGLLTAFLHHAGGESAASHAAAAAWFREHADTKRTMHHLLLAGQQEQAAAYLRECAEGLFRSGRAAEVLYWSGQLVPPEQEIALHLLRVAWGQVLSDSFDSAVATSARLDAEVKRAQLKDPGVGVPDLAAEAAVLRAFLAATSADPRTMVTSAREATHSPMAQSLGIQMAPVLLVRGLVWAGRYEQAMDTVRRTDLREMSSDLVRELNWRSQAAATLLHAGRVREARVQWELSHDWCRAHDVSGQGFRDFTPDLVGAQLTFEAGRFDEAAAHAEAVLEEATALQHLGFATDAAVQLGLNRLAMGDYAVALETLTQARASVTRRTPDNLATVRLDEALALHHILVGDVVRAVRAIERLPKGTRRVLLWARLNARRQPAGVRRELETVTPATPRDAVELQLLMSDLNADRSRHRAREHVRKAARIAEQHGMGSLFARLPEQVVALAEEARVLEPDEAIDRMLTLGRPADGGTDSAFVGTPLTRREVQLLALLPTRARNAEIAARLGISVNTVKTLLRRLYSKLGASDRDDAIHKAVERGLIPAAVHHSSAAGPQSFEGSAPAGS